MNSGDAKTVVLISGGSRGLGLCLVKQFIANGYHVATFSRKRTDEINALMEASPDRLTFYEGDITDENFLIRIVNSIEKELGPIDHLINNAGIAIESVLPVMRIVDIERVFEINLTAVLKLTRLVTRKMLLRSSGTIINISSIIGSRGYRGLAAYSASKAGLDGVTRSLARELGSRGIRVNSIAPGYLETEMSATLDDMQKKQIINRTPLGRLGTPDDIAGVALFLCSEKACFITGQILTIDGGISC